MNTVFWKPVETLGSPQNRQRGAYALVVIFCVVYYFRPGDMIPALAVIPLAKITGALAIMALLLGLGGATGPKLTTEVKLTLLLWAQCCLTIPFAYWRGGSAELVFGDFLKVVIVAVLITLTVTSLARLRTILYVQACATALVCVYGSIMSAFGRAVDREGRLQVGTGPYGNANDLALMVALTWPLCLGFLLATRNPLKKALWTLGLLFMLWAVMLSQSRGGLAATMLAVWLSFWEFGVKGKRKSMVVAGILCTVILLAMGMHFGARFRAIFDPSADPSASQSSEVRRKLLIESIELTIFHPFFGVGPGDFQAVEGQWKVPHNTYAQFGAEAGVPALLLFLLILRAVFRNLQQARKSPLYVKNLEIQIWISALRASFLAYMVGAFFGSFNYNLFFYALVACSGALCNIVQQASPVESRVPHPWRALPYGLQPQTRLSNRF
jgi:putative inorganic carbon (hco3(-)) transporter